MKCNHCKIELEENEDTLCFLCESLPCCQMCGIFETKLCEYCEGWEERMSDQCWKCEEKISRNWKIYAVRGNMCSKCSLEFNLWFDLNYEW
jgi:hypothetical protein